MPSPKPETPPDASKPSSTSLPPILEPPSGADLPSYLHNMEPLEVEALPLQVALLTSEVAHLRDSLLKTMRTVSYLVKICDRGRPPIAGILGRWRGARD